MSGEKITAHRALQSSEGLGQSRRNVPKAQEAIYQFLLEIVKTWPSEEVLAEFRRLFIHHTDTVSSNNLPYLYTIVFANQEQELRHTLKRSCYILINNWELKREYAAIQQLIQLFLDPILYRHTISPTLKRLREWLRNFIASTDFQELKLFAARHEHRESHWSQRYASYLLVPQYVNLDNPLEQRQAARNLSQQLKEKFKFELAMYTALSQDREGRERELKNPTYLGDEVLRLVKKIVAKRGFFSYPNLAHLFLSQTQNLSYKAFKQSLLEYLIFSVDQDEFTVVLKQQLAEKLDKLYSDHHDKTIDNALILRTANRVIEYLTTENQQQPSALFVLLLSQGNSLTLVMVLLKLILICRHARTHLEARIANLIYYYSNYAEEECQWVVNFFEMFRIISTIYTENIEYNLVNMHQDQSSQQRATDMKTYRIFSQLKRYSILEQEPQLLAIKSAETALETEN